MAAPVMSAMATRTPTTIPAIAPPERPLCVGAAEVAAEAFADVVAVVEAETDAGVEDWEISATEERMEMNSYTHTCLQDSLVHKAIDHMSVHLTCYGLGQSLRCYD